MSLRRSVLGACLVALVAAGCGSGSGSTGRPVATKELEEAPAPKTLSLASVIDRTESASTAKAAFAVTMDLSGMPDAPDAPVKMTAEGAVDLQGQRARFSMAFPEELAGEDLPFDGPFEMVFDSSALYMRLPEGLGLTDKPWVRFSAEDGVPLLGDVAPGMGELFGPDMGLGVLEDLSDQGAEIVGRETLRGDGVTHYRLSLDPSDLGDVGGAEGAELFAGLPPMPMDLGVDDEGRFRKLTMEFDLAALMQAMLGAFAEGLGGDAGALAPEMSELPSAGMGMSVSFEAWDFGAPVDIEVPPADQVADGASLPGLAGAFGRPG